MDNSMVSTTVTDYDNLISLFDTREKVIITIIVFVILVAVYVLVFLIFMKTQKFIFRQIEKKRGNSITIQFLQRAVELAIIVLFIVIPFAGEKMATSILRSTAVVGVIVGLAANDVIKNMFSGLELSIYKPFDVGSRIMLSDGRCGIVEAMNLRHVVLNLLDTTRVILPNNVVNSMIITNYSYAKEVPRSFEVRYPVGYNSDLDKAKEIIKDTICECPLTLNEDKYKEDTPNSKMVYFLEIQESALILGATVYYPHNIRTEVLKDEINTAVFKNLRENGIEVPYNYMNVVMN